MEQKTKKPISKSLIKRLSLRLFERCEKRKQGFDYHRTGNKEAQVGCPEESAADRNRHNGLGSGKCVLP